MNHTISHLSGVMSAVHNKGRQIGSAASSNLAAHRNTGAAEIEVRIEDTDVVVSLVDEAAVSIEFGHFTENGEYVRGLYPVTRAAYGY